MDNETRFEEAEWEKEGRGEEEERKGGGEERENTNTCKGGARVECRWSTTTPPHTTADIPGIAEGATGAGDEGGGKEINTEKVHTPFLFRIAREEGEQRARSKAKPKGHLHKAASPDHPAHSKSMVEPSSTSIAE